MSHYIVIGQNAATEMLMAGLESYTDGRSEGSDGKWTETFAHLWGHRVQRQHDVTHHVDLVSVSVLAERASSWVRPRPEVQQLKEAIARFMRPDMMLLGDFHTHPYEDHQTTGQVKGWQYSDADKNHILGDNDLWEVYSSHAVDARTLNLSHEACSYDPPV